MFEKYRNNRWYLLKAPEYTYHSGLELIRTKYRFTANAMIL